jgi:DNA polymerase III alpha subunit
MRIRTGYSFRHAVGHLSEVMDRLKEIGWTHAPITDTASAFGFVKWSKLCKKSGLKPVFGVELAVTESLNAKKPIIDHWTFIATDSIAPVNRLIEIATSQFRYQPMLTVEQACAAVGVIKIVGHRTNLVLTSYSSRWHHPPAEATSVRQLKLGFSS